MSQPGGGAPKAWSLLVGFEGMTPEIVGKIAAEICILFNVFDTVLDIILSLNIDWLMLYCIYTVSVANDNFAGQYSYFK